MYLPFSYKLTANFICRQQVIFRPSKIKWRLGILWVEHVFKSFLLLTIKRWNSIHMNETQWGVEFFDRPIIDNLLQQRLDDILNHYWYSLTYPLEGYNLDMDQIFPLVGVFIVWIGWLIWCSGPSRWNVLRRTNTRNWTITKKCLAGLYIFTSLQMNYRVEHFIDSTHDFKYLVPLMHSLLYCIILELYAL